MRYKIPIFALCFLLYFSMCSAETITSVTQRPPTIWVEVTPNPVRIETAPIITPYITISPTPQPTRVIDPRTIGTVVVTNDRSVRVRKNSNAESKQIGLINPGESYLCVGTAKNGWYEILYPTGGSGFVSNKLAELQNDVYHENTFSYIIGTVQVADTAKGREIYNGGSIYAESMGYAKRGATYSCVGVTTSGWFALLSPDKGYIVYISPQDATWVSGTYPSGTLIHPDNSYPNIMPTKKPTSTPEPSTGNQDGNSYNGYGYDSPVDEDDGDFGY
ncbi:hypothetical protein FACS1894184_05910 [Clostridia bacterium]|nr:hypothetical protein FACS1894184_05910 [Clostridia bacterium]